MATISLLERSDTDAHSITCFFIPEPQLSMIFGQRKGPPGWPYVTFPTSYGLGGHQGHIFELSPTTRGSPYPFLAFEGRRTLWGPKNGQKCQK